MENKILHDMMIKGLIRIDRKARSPELNDLIAHTKALLPNQIARDNFDKCENMFISFLENLDLDGIVIGQN